MTQRYQSDIIGVHQELNSVLVPIDLSYYSRMHSNVYMHSNRYMYLPKVISSIDKVHALLLVPTKRRLLLTIRIYTAPFVRYA